MWKIKEHDSEKEKQLIEGGKHRFIARLLAQRDVDIDTVDEFLLADYKQLSHPHSLSGVKEAVDLFCKVAKQKGRVAVIGDYDCDGVISSVMLKELCNLFDLECQVFLPSRLSHGYGLNEKTVNAFCESLSDSIDLLFVSDCGANNKAEIEQFKKMGMKVIVIDHHLFDENISDNADAMIHWKLGEGTNEMCACGEVFQFIRGIRWVTKRVDPLEFLSYAAIGTIADLSPLDGDNRIIVKHGLSQQAFNHVRAYGLEALIKSSKIYNMPITPEDISFKIAPRINAVGRLFHPDMVFGLLIERDHDLAEKIAGHLLGYNDERKLIQKKIEEEAVEKVNNCGCKKGIAICNKDWHIGVVGIVASRLVETYNMPSIVIGQHDGIWKGSGRSVPGVNLKAIADLCSEAFEGYGGHEQAIGVTVKPEYVDKIQVMFDEACTKYFHRHKIPSQQVRYYDASLSPKAITPDLVYELSESLPPYCAANNREPVFKLKNMEIHGLSVRDGGTWRLLTFNARRGDEDFEYPFKFFSTDFDTGLNGKEADIFFTFPQGYSRGNRLELTVVDIIPKDNG